MFYMLRGSDVTGYMNTAASNGYPDLGPIGVEKLTPAVRSCTSRRRAALVRPPDTRGEGRSAALTLTAVRGACWSSTTPVVRSTAARPSRGGLLNVRLHRPARVRRRASCSSAMSMVTFVMFFASPIDPAQFACGKNCSPRSCARRSARAWATTSRSASSGRLPQGRGLGPRLPRGPESLRESAPELVAHCAAPCLGYSRVNIATVHRGVQGPDSRVRLARDRGVPDVDRRRRRSRRDRRDHKGSIIDRGLVGTALVFYAFPTFFVGLFLLKFLAIKWQIVPVPDVHLDRRRRHRHVAARACSCPG